MWFTFVIARLFLFLSFQPRLAATLLRSCSVVNSLTRRTGLSPAFQSASLAQQWVRLAEKPVLNRRQLRKRRMNCHKRAHPPSPSRVERGKALTDRKTGQTTKDLVRNMESEISEGKFGLIFLTPCF